tara:strand:- start:15029 stop:17041 length:2013 start_codon:yes stop_codon:yes gene_type:complete
MKIIKNSNRLTDKMKIHSFIKPLIGCTVLLLYLSGFSQDIRVKNLTPKSALDLSEKYTEKAKWYTDMPQYNMDSSLYYANKALEVLNPEESLHQTKLYRLQFERLKKSDRVFSFSKQDSMAEIAWNKVKDLNTKNKDNRLLLFDHLTYWSDIKMNLGDRIGSLDLFTKAISLMESYKLPESEAKISLYKGLFYGKYGLPEENHLSVENLVNSLRYYEKAGLDKYSTELYMIYAQLVFQHTGKNRDSTNFYYDRLKKLLEEYKKPMAHIWYYNMTSYDLIQQALPDGEGVNEKKYEEARQNIIQGMDIIEAYGFQNTTFYPHFFSLIADVDYYTKNFNAALVNYRKAYELYQAMNDEYYSNALLKSMSDTHKEMGDFENALAYQEQYYTETLQTEKEKNQRSLRENELQLGLNAQEKSLSQKQNQQTLLLILLGLSILTLALFYRNFRLKQTSNLKLGLANKELNIKNKQNELLLKEIHHRVKNNLELVKSLISLQSAQLEDSATKDAMMASQNRVQSMGIIHQKLYQGENLGSIEMKDYFLNLGEGILDTFNAEDKVKIECAMDNLELDVDTAVPIGLIVNELLTNALKYAFPENRNGTIQISLSQASPETLSLKVIDNGVGKNTGVAPKGTGFGSQLIQLLTQQLNGTMTENGENGTMVAFNFKIKTAA